MPNNPGRPEPLSPVKQALLAVEQLKARLAVAERRQREPIAIVGIGCRFPGRAHSPQDFWNLLATGANAVTRIPANRWDAEAYYDPNPEAPGKAYTTYGAFLEGIDEFDAQFFSIAPIEAASMDPQQRLLLEVSWEALEHGGLAGASLRGSRTGIFTGICNSDYLLYTLGSRDPQRVDAFAGTGSANSIAAGRLSYFYDFHGPNFPIDTACSSSLAALHLAVQSLRNRECDMALAAGVSAMLAPEPYVYFAKTRALSAGPKSYTFDARADGYVRGEGCGVLVLKRLIDAEAAGDRVLAVIRGTAMNHDGRTGGLTAPNGPAQQDVIRAALANAGVVPDEVTYVETHGTGTPLGDPIEVQALGAAYRAAAPAKKRKLYIGAVKTNIGHLEGAAGIAGAIKAALMLHHRELVPHLHFEQPSPHIPWADLPVEVVTARRPWPAGQPLLAGISAFGFSGTNVHVIMEAASEPAAGGRESGAPTRQASAWLGEAARPQVGRRTHVLPMSARTVTGLKRLAGRYAAHLRQPAAPPLGDICHTAAIGRAHFPHRLAVVGADAIEIAERLQAFEQGNGSAPGLRAHHARPQAPPRLVFQFSGQGAQFPGMGRDLYESEPLFRARLDECDQLLRPHLDISIRAAMFGAPLTGSAEKGPLALDETWLAQPALFAFEYALASLWRSWGLEPEAVIGHSIGEYVAACLAGVFTLEDALYLVAARGRLMQALPRAGAMVAAFAPETRVEAALVGKVGVDIAAVNGPDHVVLSGVREAVLATADELEIAGVATRSLRVSHAFHSPLMEPVLQEYQRIAAEVAYHPPRLPMIANLTGRFFGPGEAPDTAYWTRHVRQTVRYFDGLQTLVAGGYSLFVEVGPRAVLTDLGQHIAPEAGHWLASCRPNHQTALYDSLAALYGHGCPIDWEAVYPRGQHRRVDLPTYPFEHKRYWLDRTAAAQPQAAATPAPAARNGSGASLLNAFVDVLE
ncbi:MAG: type I polyketide synthase [Anaerolineales bacterium]|nr:type I polyketide synthase [Anaerolineales bacterium]